MVNQIQIMNIVEDGRAKRVLGQIKNLSKDTSVVSKAVVVDTYTIDAKLTKVELEKVAEALHTPLSQSAKINRPLSPKKFSFAIEVGYLPGVTDNVGTTARETIEDTLKKVFSDNEVVYYSKVYFFDGSIKQSAANEIAHSLHNPLIQRVAIKSFIDFAKDSGMDIVVPKVKLETKPVTLVDLYVSDEELTIIGKRGIPNGDQTYRGPLGLGLSELKAIRSHFHRLGRWPTDVELEALAQTWSEHCKHTIFANPLDDITQGIYRHYIKRATKEIRQKKGKADFCVSVFSDNSGVIKFDKDTYLSHKVETHNSPSALDPFGGAITGILGVNRDTIGTGLGARPLLNMYGYCLSDPDDKTRLWRDQNKTQELLPAERIMNGVIDGVNSGGNESGIPTPQGFTYFEERYRGKPLVFVGTVGILPKMVAGKPSYKKGAKPGDCIVMVGGKVGLDGIHGATFSSEALDSGSPATAVQIGDAITQKKLSDVLIKEARDLGLYNSITDNGAGGLSSSVGEMAEESGGCEVWLDKVPVKYAGLAPWQIWISESQERITLSVPKKNCQKLIDLMRKRGVQATVMGKFTGSGACQVVYDGQLVVNISMDFLHDGNPIELQQSKAVLPKIIDIKEKSLVDAQKNLSKTILEFVASANIGSTEFISSQYDHEVQGVSVTKPLQGKGRVSATATVSRPSTDTVKGIVLSQGLCPRYSDIDTYHMAASAIDQAIRNVVVTGADPDYIALLDNFCWCSSNEPERLYELKRAAQACYDFANAFETPFISGKDSMFNDFKGFDAKGKPIKISVPPTLLVSAISVMPDVSKSVTLDAKNSGDSIFLLGETKSELGGSEYAAFLGRKDKTNYTGANVPQVDAIANKKLYQKYYKATKKGLIASGIALDRGGLSVSLMKTLVAGQLGGMINLDRIKGDLNISEKLFSESNGRILVTVAPDKQAEFEKLMTGVACVQVGVVADTEEVLIMNGKVAVSEFSLEQVTKAYRSKFKNA
jgi:phosphoribosylformylglycinamidine synthase II